MSWHKSDDETKVVKSAMKAFWRRGYKAISLDDLVKVTGINRGSMYNAFAHMRRLFR